MTTDTVRPVRLDVYRTAIPMRSFEHAAAQRDVAEAVVVRVVFSDRTIGWGETLPREYVTGETIDSVVRDIQEVLWPICREVVFDANVLHNLLAFRAAGSGQRCMNAAAAAVELACIWRTFATVPRRAIPARVSGVLGWADPNVTAKRLRLMRLFGLRDFKLKLGLGEEVDAANLRLVHGRLGKALERGKATLRVDVNGAWDVETAPERVAGLKQFGVCVVEQPVYCSAGELADLATRCELPLMADESLLRNRDIKALLSAGNRMWWNIRLSKNGGMLRSLALARFAADRGVPFTLGCMVGESSILSAMQRVMLQMGVQPRFVEGNYGRFLLADDLTRKSLRFGRGGRLRAITNLSRIAVLPAKLNRYGAPAASMEA